MCKVSKGGVDTEGSSMRPADLSRLLIIIFDSDIDIVSLLVCLTTSAVLLVVLRRLVTCQDRTSERPQFALDILDMSRALLLL